VRQKGVKYVSSASDLIPDDPEDILDEEDLPTLDRWTERAAYDLWTLGDEVETSTPERSMLQSYALASLL
jgi:hypothetical protein